MPVDSLIRKDIKYRSLALYTSLLLMLTACGGLVTNHASLNKGQVSNTVSLNVYVLSDVPGQVEEACVTGLEMKPLDYQHINCGSRDLFLTTTNGKLHELNSQVSDDRFIVGCYISTNENLTLQNTNSTHPLPVFAKCEKMESNPDSFMVVVDD